MADTVNMYGVPLNRLKREGTKGELRLKQILLDMGVKNVVMGFAYPTPYRRNKFDLAVFADGAELPGLLVEYDGEPHDDIRFYRERGNRPCRNEMHVLKTMRSDAMKYGIAAKFGGQVLRITHQDMENEAHVRRLLATYVSIYVDGNLEKCPEVATGIMCERYFPDMIYVRPSSPSKRETEYLHERDERGAAYVCCKDAPCMYGGMCPNGLV